MEFWKALIIFKEIKKSCNKYLRMWAKSLLRFKISEKILKFTCKNLNGKLIFYPFSLPSCRTFVILYTSGTCQWGGSGGATFAGFGGGGTFEFGFVVGVVSIPGKSVYSVASGGGGTPERSPPRPKPEKLLQQSGIIFQRAILSERSQKSKKYLVKIVKKVNFPQRF